MRVAVLGAGCIGSLVGCRMHAAGIDVTFIDLPQRAENIRNHGITLRHADGDRRHYGELAVLDTVSLAPDDHYDVVIVAVKAHHIVTALGSLRRLAGSETIVVTTQNGIPWWYFFHHGGPFDRKVIEASDPAGVVSSAIDARNVVGCIAYPAVAMGEHDEVVHVEGNRMPVGPVHPAETHKAEAVSGLMTQAGFKSPVLGDLRDETWLKAIGNMSLNPISALTHATLAQICEHDDAKTLVRRMMEEAEAVATALGARLRVSIDRRIDGARRVGHHRSSMLQDVGNGESMEVEALIAAVVELGELTGVPTPRVGTVMALARLLNETVRRGPTKIVALPAGA